MKHWIVQFIFCLSVGISCNKECNDLTSYIFELPATLSPAKDTFRIGDTITITSEFSDEVYDRATKRKYKLENWKFNPGTAIYNIGNEGSFSCIGTKFEFLFDSNYNYNLLNTNSIGNILTGQFSYFGNKYLLQIKFIAQKKGLFLVEQNCDIYLSNNQTFEGRCPKNKAGLDAFVRMNDGVDNNIHMLSSSPDPHYNDWVLRKPEERFHKWGGYCFYVKE